MKALLIKLIIANIGVIIGDIILFTISGDNVTQIVTAGLALIGVIIGLRVKRKIETVNSKVDDYHKEVDGKVTKLIEAVEGKAEAEVGKAKAEGFIEGAATQSSDVQTIKDAVEDAVENKT